MFKQKIVLGISIFFALVTLAPVLGTMQKAHAISGTTFNAGRIIDDQVFFNPSGLSISEIQNFLNSKVSSCDTNGQLNKSYYYNPNDGYTSGSSPDPHGGSTWVTTIRAVYGQHYDSYYGVSYAAAPYTCLESYVSNTTYEPADAYCSGYPVATKSAAEIIYGVAQSCGINPRVLIVLLQKEQGLVTDDWPWQSEYQSATGYACPDTSACDSQYYGFFNQVYSAARQFKRYAASPANYQYVAQRNNFIQWNPNASCGGSSVYIQNQATAGLYNYTPYQPNQAALNAGYGTGDSCSSYGNRNFWLYYNDWFGSPYTPTYWWTPSSQGVYADSSLTAASGPFVVGQRRYVQIKVQNSGAATWYQGQIFLGTWNPQDRQSAFYDPSWVRGNRAATISEASVPPGGTGTFGFWVTASQAGNFNEYFNLVEEGVTWLNDNGLYIPFSVQPKNFSWSVSSQTIYANPDFTNPLPYSATITRGETAYARVVATNTGNVTWTNDGPNPVKIATNNPRDRASSFCNGSWGGCARPTVMKESSVAPGQTGTFEFQLQPSSVGNYREYFTLVSEGQSWFNDPGMYFPISVPARQYKWSVVSQAAYSDSGLTNQLPYNFTMTKGQSVYLALQVKNQGNITWNKSVLLGTWAPQDRSSSFYDPSWPSTNRAAAFQGSQGIAPGATATYVVKITASQSGSFREYFNLVWDGQSWFNDLGLYYPIIVQ